MHYPKKRLGQNFLTDPNIIAKIVEVLALRSADRVLEIGPGHGALTKQLAGRVAELVAVEMDKALAEELSAYFANRGDVRIINTDFLAYALPTATNATGWRVVGNIPYNISTPILFHVHRYREHVTDATYMLQKEVADRILASPNCKEYGRLSIALQLCYWIEKCFPVSKHCFFPQPKVESIVIRLRTKTQAQCPKYNAQRLDQIVRQAFGQRRKTLQKSLRQLITPEQMRSLSIDPIQRPETLSPEQFAAMSLLPSLVN